MMTKYVSVSGVTTAEEAAAVICAPRQPKGPLRLGLLCSAKTLGGGELSARSVRLDQIRDISYFGFVAAGDVEAWPHMYVTEPSRLRQLVRDLGRLFTYGGDETLIGNMLGLQLNYPGIISDRDAANLAEARRIANPVSGHLPRVVLQIGPKVLSAFRVASSTLDASVMLTWYVGNLFRGGAITDILIDPSAGTGRALDVGEVFPIVERLTPLTEEGLGVGVAGGLSPERLASLKPLVEVYPSLSIDAESSLRDEHDRLDIAKVNEWLAAAAEAGW